MSALQCFVRGLCLAAGLVLGVVLGLGLMSPSSAHGFLAAGP